MLKQHWNSLPSSGRIILVIAAAECLWIILLQIQIGALLSQTQMQQARIAQLEQSVKKHNNLLYSMYMTNDDILKKWNDLNFRVLQNTWKLDP